jgi:hypothetical protein
MNTNHRLNPEELDAYLTARQQGENPERSVASAPQEIKLAENILNLAETAQPDPAFAAALEEQLRFRQPQPGGQGQKLSALTERKIVMFRRILFPLAGAAALLLLAIFILPKFSPKPLQPLPALAAAAPNLAAPNAAPLAAGRDALAAKEGAVLNSGTFSGTEFILQIELPGMPDKITVYQQPTVTAMSVADFRKLADRFGLQGTIYTQAMPILYDMAREGASKPADIRTSYILFDGTRQLSGGDWGGVSYYDRGVTPYTQPGEAPAAEQIIPLAEAFLKERGLLDFPYRAEVNPYAPDMVSFYRVIEDKPLASSEIEVQMGAGNQVISVSYHLAEIQPVGDYPIRSAQEAWDALVAGNITWDQMSFWTYSTTPIPVDPSWPVYQGWQPQYHPDETAELLGYIAAYQPAEGEQAPIRLTVGDLELSASDTDRQILAGLTDRQLLITGQIRQTERGGLVLDVTGWQDSNATTATFTGSIQRQGENALLLRSDGVTFWLPHTPATLTDGLQVDCYGWETTRQENGYPVLEWNYLQTPPTSEMGATTTVSSDGAALPPDQPLATVSPAPSSGTSSGSEGAVDPAAKMIGPDTVPTPPNFAPGNTAEAVEGQLYATVSGNEDGSYTYSIQLGEMPLTGQGWYAELSGSQLEALSKFDRQWVRVWGQYGDNEWPVINVERFEVVDPSRTVQAWLGQVVTETIESQVVNVLITPDQQHLVIASSVHWPDAYLYSPYEPGRQVIFEGVLRSETLGGYPVMEDINWVSNDTVDQMTSASEYTLPMRPEVYPYVPPPPLLPGKAIVDQVELAYSVTYTYVEATNTTLQFVQPVWRFTGHTEDGTRFVILMQAVDPQYIQ